MCICWMTYENVCKMAAVYFVSSKSQLAGIAVRSRASRVTAEVKGSHVVELQRSNSAQSKPELVPYGYLLLRAWRLPIFSHTY